MKKRNLTACLGAAASVILLGASLVVTYPNEYKMIRQFGEIVRVVETPGVSFKMSLSSDRDIDPQGSSDLRYPAVRCDHKG